MCPRIGGSAEMNEIKESPICYPELSELGKLEAEQLIENMKSKFRKAFEDVMGDLYIDIPDYIESDSWTNYRNTLLSQICDYRNARGPYRYDYQKIRTAIYEQFKEQINKDLNHDLLAEVESLKKHIQFLEGLRHG
jgi:hypothetical protein